MTESIVRSEFDRLSALPETWDFNHFYHRHLLSMLPSAIDSLLDVGCGTGAFSRLAASRCGSVMAVDLSPGMIARARQISAPANVSFSVADVFDMHHAPGSFDAIISIAALHHMNLPEALDRFSSLLRPGGTLVLLDLFVPSNLLERLTSWIGVILSPLVRLIHSRRLFQSPAVRRAWSLHEAHDHYPALPVVRSVAREILPGAQVRLHLFWRYSLVWRKPSSS